MEAIQTLEGAVLLAIQSIRNPVLDPLLIGFTSLGNAGILWIVLSLVMVCRKPTRRAGVLALLSMLLGLLFTNLFLKNLVARPRPWLDVAGLIPMVSPGDASSFPSGHTCAAFAAGLSWAKTLPWPWGRYLALGLAVCMGLSRLYVGVHYPTDVIGGALVGALCAWLAEKLLCAWEKRRNGTCPIT